MRKLERTYLPSPEMPVLLHYRDQFGARQFTTPDAAALVAFELGGSVRKLPRYKGQRHTSGQYWSATEGRHLEFESHLECQWMMLFDFDPHVVAMQEQPFHIQCLDPRDSWEHVPDLFLRCRDGTGWVVDVRRAIRAIEPDVELQSARTRDLCRRIGFRYSVVTEPDHITWANVEWLSRYRRPFPVPAELSAEILHRATQPIPIGVLADGFDRPQLARTVVQRQCWFGSLWFDRKTPLRDSTLVHTRGTQE